MLTHQRMITEAVESLTVRLLKRATEIEAESALDERGASTILHWIKNEVYAYRCTLGVVTQGIAAASLPAKLEEVETVLTKLLSQARHELYRHDTNVDSAVGSDAQTGVICRRCVLPRPSAQEFAARFQRVAASTCLAAETLAFILRASENGDPFPYTNESTDS